MGKFIDLTGRQFNRWTVIERVQNNFNNKTKWLCRCSCENHTIRAVNSSDLISKKSQSCGCLVSEVSKNKAIDLTGQKFGKLTAIKRGITKSDRQTTWICVCDCDEDNFLTVKTNSLLSGNTKSCGCLANEYKTKYNLNTIGGFGVCDVIKISDNTTDFSFCFDIEDYNKINKFNWRKTADGHIYAKEKKETIWLHRLIMDCPIEKEVDHIDGNTFDNRKSKLRICTHSQNSKNRKLGKNNTSGCKGVSWNRKKQKWIVRIQINHKEKQIGAFKFEDLDKAVFLRREAERLHYGEYRRDE